jgi:P4 family phage/plasmid primase-like protien
MPPPQSATLRFLENFRVEPGNGHPYNFQDFSNKADMWMVPEDEMNTFYRLYFEDLENTIPLYLTEKQTRIGQLRVDLDFKYAGELPDHKHTQAQTLAFIAAYMEEVKKYHPVDEVIEVFVLEKTKPTYNATDKVSRSGIHIQIPDIKTQSGIELEIKNALVPRMEEFFPNLGLLEPWDKVYDKSVLSHNSMWMVLGSKKNDGLPYKVKYVANWDPETGEVDVDPDVPKLNVDLIKRLSVRSKDSDETAWTDHAKQRVRYISARDRAEPLTGAQRALSAGRGRTTTRGGDDTRSSSPGRIIIPPPNQELVDYYAAHLDNLAEFRYTNYSDWIAVGQCLKNLYPSNGDDNPLKDLWHMFSRKGGDSYNPNECENKWRSFSFRMDGVRLGVGSLRHWSATDDFEQFKKIEEKNIIALVVKSAETGTENDVAQVIYAKYRDEFKCAKFGQNIWYRYNGQIWTETDRGVALQVRLSKTIADMYLDAEMKELTNIRNLGQCQDKEFNPTCQSCEAEKRRKQYNSTRLKLKRTGFKESVMKECRELFLDEQLALRLDENKHLIAFENGVFDTLSLEFRDGRPEDYISFSTKVKYDPERTYSSYECWAELNKFLTSILPDQAVREYFLRHLCTCLSGGNEAQKFHILTGSGSNGKSMLMNLVSTAFGDYSCKAPISLLTQQRNKSAAAAPELVRMKGRRFVTMQEPDEQVPLNTGLMKELASCEKITARDLYAGSKQMIDFDIQARFHLACNEKPKVNTTDGGTWRRLVVIDFPMKFVPHPTGLKELPIDESIVQKVVSEEWAECFMSYLVQLYKDGNGWRKITPPPKVMEYTNEYKVESDIIARFMGEYIHPLFDAAGAPIGDGPPEPTSKNALTTTFQEWKRSNELHGRAAATELVKRVEAAYGKYHTGGWTGFRFGQA